MNTQKIHLIFVVFAMLFFSSHVGHSQIFAERIEGDYVLSYKLNQINQFAAKNVSVMKGKTLYETLAREDLFVKDDSLLVSFRIEDESERETLTRMNQSGARFHQVLKDNIYYTGWVQIDSLLLFPEKFPETKIQFKLQFDIPNHDNEGPDRINSVTYETGTSTNPNAGNGITIAILDSGWDGYNLVMNDGLVPSSFTYYDCSSGNCIQATIPGGIGNCTNANGCRNHGVNSTQTVFDHAPAANYLIYNTPSFNNEIKAAAIEHAANQGVDIITCSQSSYNTGWNDDSGVVCAAVNDPDASEMLMFFSSGNRNGDETTNGSHWQGDFNGDVNNFHRWDGNDIVNNRTQWVPDSARFHVRIQCDNDSGPSGTNLYKIEIINALNDSILANDFFAQSVFVPWRNLTGANVPVGIRVQALTSSRPEFEMWSHNVGRYQYFSTSNQTLTPGNCSNNKVMEIAAVDQQAYITSDPEIMWYSSSGPSNEGKKTISLAGPTNTQVTIYDANGNSSLDNYGGTSCATPNVAGAAAAFWSKHSSLSAQEVRNILIRKAQDWGEPGLDDNFGYGGSFLFDYNSRNIYLDQFAGSSGNSPSNGVYPWHSLKDIHNKAPDNRNVIMLTNDSETAPFSISKKMTIYAPEIPRRAD